MSPLDGGLSETPRVRSANELPPPAAAPSAKIRDELRILERSSIPSAASRRH